MKREHHYELCIQWLGNTGSGTSGYRAYQRDHSIKSGNKPAIQASSDPAFLGDKTKYNPEELLVASLSSCHMLWYLHLCAEAGVVVTDYTDNATGIMAEAPDGSGHFTSVTLHPVVTVLKEEMVAAANAIHEKAHQFCFIAQSVNFPVQHSASAVVQKAEEQQR